MQKKMFKNIDILKQIDAAAKAAGKPIHWGQTMFGAPDHGSPENFTFKAGDAVKDSHGNTGRIVRIGESGIRAIVEGLDRPQQWLSNLTGIH